MIAAGAVDFARWRGARRAHSHSYVTDEQRSQRAKDQARREHYAPDEALVSRRRRRPLSPGRSPRLHRDVNTFAVAGGAEKMVVSGWREHNDSTNDGRAPRHGVIAGRYQS